MYADPQPLPASSLDRLPVMCTRTQSASLCNKLTEVLWDSGRFLQAREMAGQACKPRLEDPEACRRAKATAMLDAATLNAPSAAGLPCGTFSSETALLSELTFKDKGIVTTSFGGDKQARLEGGLIRIRHDKGGDFILRRLANGSLLGMDTWNRFVVYVPTNKADARCGTRN